VTVFPCEEIIGSMKEVKDFGAFHAAHKVALENAQASFLLDYCSGANFTPAELNAFRFGLDCMFSLFEKAEADTESYAMEAEQKKSVG
jgi:hypothetical protein